MPRLADWCAVELPDERGVLRHVALAHVDPAMEAEGRALRERYPPDPEQPAGSHAVLRDGRSQLYADVPDDVLEAGARDAEHLERARRLDIGTVMIVPMRTRGRALGVMTFVRGHGRHYGEGDLRFAEDLAARAATAVENARLYTERSEVAHTLQASLLPEQLPQLPGWRAAADYRPGQAGAEVGGDFYDAFPVDGGSMVILGDVTGKGVTAAALTSLVRHTANGRPSTRVRRRCWRLSTPRCAGGRASRRSRCCAPCSATARSRSPPAGIRCRSSSDPAGRRRWGTGCCSAPWTTTRRRRTSSPRRARGHARALHGRRDGHRGRARALRRDAAAGRGGGRSGGARGAARGVDRDARRVPARTDRG